MKVETKAKDEGGYKGGDEGEGKGEGGNARASATVNSPKTSTTMLHSSISKSLSALLPYRRKVQ